MKKLFLFLTLLLSMEAAFPSDSISKSKLESICSEMEDIIRYLPTNIDLKIDELVSEINDLDRESQKVKDDASDLKSIQCVGVFESEYRMHDKAVDLDRNAQNLQSKIGELKRKVDNLKSKKNEIDKLRSGIDNLKSKISELSREVGSYS